MSRKIAVFLCLVLTFWGIPQTNNKVSADLGSCPDNDISRTVEYTVEGNATKYPMDPSVILPKETNAIYFTLRGKLTQGKSYEAYIKKAGEARWDLPTGHSNKAVFNGESIALSIDKATASQLFGRTQTNDSHYEVNLLEGEPFDDNHPLCRITNYKIGLPVNFKRCSITLNKSEAGRGEDILASVSNVQLGSGDYQIIYSKPNGIDSVDKTKSPTKVAIDPQGNGSFIFWTGPTFLNGASVAVIVNFETTDYSCSAEFSIVNKEVSTSPSCIITVPGNPERYSVLDTPQLIATNLQEGVTYWARLIYKNLGQAKDLSDRVVAVKPQLTATFLKLSPTGTLDEGTYAAEVYRDPGLPADRQCISKDFIIGPPNVAPVPPAKACDRTDPNCSSGGGQSCSDDPNNPGFVTAIGCIHTNPTELIKDLMKFVIGISGGLAFLMMLLGAFQMLTSAGNPETLSAGRDRLTSAVIGLLFVIFAILLLQIIGVDILKIPGFGR